MELKEYRKNLNITIKEASNACSIPLRTYFRYENDNNYGNSLKRKMIFKILEEKYKITEEKGILPTNIIIDRLKSIFKKYEDKIEFCYLFGSYAKGYATEKSDVDLCISTSLTGFDYLGLLEEIRESLNKKIDLLRLVDLKENIDLINEIMKDGIKIYEQQKR